MLNLTLILTLLCPVTAKINRTKEPWNELDNSTLLDAKQGCKRLYKDSPCLKKFIKKDINNYYAICGKET